MGLISSVEWRDIDEYEGLYKISSDGEILSISSHHFNCKNGQRTPSINANGYYSIQLFNRGVIRTIDVHRLVAIAFVPNPNNFSHVNHIDKIKTNNHYSNLEWCTNQYNVMYSIGKAVGQYDKYDNLINTFPSLTDAAIGSNAKVSNISKVCRGKRNFAGGYKWRYLS
jgi:hypothetical protein